jgi:intracellular septation protein
MQFLVDYFPLLLFFIAFKLQGIYVATGVAMVASIVQIAWLRFKRGRVAPIHWLSLAIITIFGGATLILQDETWIKWKPTVLYGLFGMILAVGRVGFGRNLISYVMHGINLPSDVWTRVTWSWVAFFAFMGIANWYVAFHYSLDAWVNFKVWGGIGLFLTFALVQGLFLARHLVAEEPR